MAKRTTDAVDAEKADKKQPKQNVHIVALQDTQLANGEFVGKHSTVEVDADYAALLLAEIPAHFELSNKEIK